MTPVEFRERTKQLALRIIRLCGSLPSNRTNDIFARQLLRCGTSVGANYRAACRARSKADFVAKMAIVEEEVDECSYWIELLVATDQVSPKRVRDLLTEIDELTRMVSASRKTARPKPNRRSTIDNRHSGGRSAS